MTKGIPHPAIKLSAIRYPITEYHCWHAAPYHARRVALKLTQSVRQQKPLKTIQCGSKDSLQQVL